MNIIILFSDDVFSIRASPPKKALSEVSSNKPSPYAKSAKSTIFDKENQLPSLIEIFDNCKGNC